MRAYFNNYINSAFQSAILDQSEPEQIRDNFIVVSSNSFKGRILNPNYELYRFEIDKLILPLHKEERKMILWQQ